MSVTAGPRLFSRLRQSCAELVARSALDRILKDEVRHRDFGWTLLEWLLSTPASEAVLTLAAAELPHMFERLRASYFYASFGREAERDPIHQRRGLMPACDYAPALLESYERD